MAMNRWTAMAAFAAFGVTTTVAARTHHPHPRPSHAKKSHATAASSGPASDLQVRQLFDLMHMSQTLAQANSQMVTMMAQNTPCIPASYWQGFIGTGSTQQIMDRLVPVYQRHFTAGDVGGLLKFYRSPLGQKVVVEMPLAVAEGMKLNQQWGIDRGHQMIQQLQQHGSLDTQGRCPAGGMAAQPAAAASTAGPVHAPPAPAH
jgi:hypothetical protein